MTEYLPYLALAVSVAVNVLQFVAPKTKTTVDDRLLEVLEELAKHLPALVAAAKPSQAKPAAV